MTANTTTTTLSWDAINTTEGELDAGGTLTLTLESWWDPEILAARDAQGRDLWPILSTPARAEVQAAFEDALFAQAEGERDVEGFDYSEVW